MWSSARGWVCVLFALLSFPWTAGAHEVTFDARICVCIGDLEPDGRVDEGDVQKLLDCFDGSCTVIDTDIEPGKECSQSEGCPADLNNNHLVGEGDLRILLGHWGPCPEAGDVNEDGVADMDDVLAVLGRLGTDCLADLDGQGKVDGNDIAMAEAAWFGGDGYFEGADADGDGNYTIADLLRVVENLGVDCRADIDGNGTVECLDFEYACGFAGVDCSTLSCP